MANYYDSATGTYHPIPKAPFYVLSKDTFMSGWGPAKNMTNTCVVPCESYYEAERVEAYVRSRSDQKYIRTVAVVRPRLGVIYSLCDGWRDRARERDLGEPTWENQLRYARRMPDSELTRHASVSKNNNHRCEDCFCCAALTVIEERTQANERRRRA